MQLNKHSRAGTMNKGNGNIKEKLTLATCTLLQVTSPSAHAASHGWEMDSALMVYSESDGRVSAIEPVVSAKKEVRDDEFLTVKVVLDSLTGATPNGAHASSSAQTFTSPSGSKSYSAQPNETPLDDTFHDSRVALSASLDKPIDHLSRVIWSANVSNEFDYQSLGASATYLRDFNNRNTTFAAALGFNADSVSPIGGVPVPFAHMRTANADITATRDGSSDSKTIGDVMLGVTQVLSRKTLMQFNLGFSSTSGYQNDPYKILTVVDSTSGLPIAAVGDDLPYLYESRPDSRSRQTFYWKTVHHLDEDVINLAYRYYTDDWDVSSHTLDLHYRYELGNGAYLQPHVRYYSQTAANFFRTSLVNGDPLPEFASADYRLGEFTSTTLGLKYAKPTGRSSEFSVRGEVVSQVQQNVTTPIGDQANQDLTPDLNSFVIQVGYSTHW